MKGNLELSTRRFEGEVAVVTGAGQGIGRATALRLAREGAAVVVADRNQGLIEELADTINQEGGRAHAVAVDLEHCEGALELFAVAERLHGRVDISIHNVGGTIWMKPFVEYRPDEIVAEIQRSLWPTLWCCHAVVPAMLSRRSGSIVNLGSIATRGINRAPYSAAKGGVSALTTTLAIELAPHGIRVNCIAPGGIQSTSSRHPGDPTADELQWRDEVIAQTMRDTPMGRFGNAEELAASICFVASKEASYVTGQTIFAAGGAIG